MNTKEVREAIEQFTGWFLGGATVIFFTYELSRLWPSFSPTTNIHAGVGIRIWYTLSTRKSPNHYTNKKCMGEMSNKIYLLNLFI